MRIVAGPAVLGLLLAVGMFVPAHASALIVVGPSKHPPGTHEVAAGARLMKDMIEHAQGVRPLTAEVVTAWPAEGKAFDGVATIVFIGDLFPAETLEDPAQIKADLARLMNRGCGMVCVHYATGLRAQNVPADGDHPLLRWIGGYFASRCPHHQSVARVVDATLEPGEGSHPVLRGWKAFSFHDEPYWDNYFGAQGMAPNVTPLAIAQLPPEKPVRQVVGWGIERPDGGRGVGLVVPHFYRNWRIDDLRVLVLNSIYWTAKAEIPAQGVKSPRPDLARYEPAAVEPPPKKAAKK